MVEGHLRETLRRYEEVMAELAAPETHEDSVRLQRLLKEQAELSPLVACMEALQRAKEREAEALSLLETERDEELRQLAKEELQEARQEKARHAAELKELLLPKDPNDEKNVVLEIRAGAGGRSRPPRKFAPPQMQCPRACASPSCSLPGARPGSVN